MSTEGLFGPVTFATSKHVFASCFTIFFVVPHSAVFTPQPVAILLGAGELRAIRTHNGVVIHLAANSTGIRSRLTYLWFHIFCGTFVAGFCFRSCDWLAFFTCSGDVKCVTAFLLLDVTLRGSNKTP